MTTIRAMQAGRHHARIEWRLTKPAFVACDDLRQIQVLARQHDDELRQMVRRYIIDDRRRQELRPAYSTDRPSDEMRPRPTPNCSQPGSHDSFKR